MQVQKQIELSQSKRGEQVDSFQRLVTEFDECMQATNLETKVMLGKRECLNFLSKLTIN